MSKKMTMAEKILNAIPYGNRTETKADVLDHIFRQAEVCAEILNTREWHICGASGEAERAAICILGSIGIEFQWDTRRNREVVRIARTRCPVASALWRRVYEAREMVAAGNYDVQELIPGLPW